MSREYLEQFLNSDDPTLPRELREMLSDNNNPQARVPTGSNGENSMVPTGESGNPGTSSGVLDQPGTSSGAGPFGGLFSTSLGSVGALLGPDVSSAGSAGTSLGSAGTSAGSAGTSGELAGTSSWGQLPPGLVKKTLEKKLKKTINFMRMLAAQAWNVGYDRVKNYDLHAYLSHAAMSGLRNAVRRHPHRKSELVNNVTTSLFDVMDTVDMEVLGRAAAYESDDSQDSDASMLLPINVGNYASASNSWTHLYDQLMDGNITPASTPPGGASPAHVPDISAASSPLPDYDEEEEEEEDEDEEVDVDEITPDSSPRQSPTPTKRPRFL